MSMRSQPLAATKGLYLGLLVVEAEAPLDLFFRGALTYPTARVMWITCSSMAILLEKPPQGKTGEAGVRSAVGVDEGGSIRHNAL